MKVLPYNTFLDGIIDGVAMEFGLTARTGGRCMPVLLKIWLTPKVWWFSDLRQVTTKQCAGNKVADGQAYPNAQRLNTFKVKV